ncbi:MAG: hypothetical protein Q7J68_03320 [Thermoplasmata archaeon]|nr:hypothetical protein [Thermoplasmata archaeon]
MNESLNELIRDYWKMELPPLKARDTDIQLKSDLISDIIGPRRAGLWDRINFLLPRTYCAIELCRN